jgi:hypothetical protein
MWVKCTLLSDAGTCMSKNSGRTSHGGSAGGRGRLSASESAGLAETRPFFRAKSKSAQAATTKLNRSRFLFYSTSWHSPLCVACKETISLLSEEMFIGHMSRTLLTAGCSICSLPTFRMCCNSRLVGDRHAATTALRIAIRVSDARMSSRIPTYAARASSTSLLLDSRNTFAHSFVDSSQHRDTLMRE